MKARLNSCIKILLWVGLVVVFTACGGRTIVDETTTETGLHSSLLIDENGSPMIAYFDKTDRMVKLALCDDAVCGNPQIVVVDDDGAIGQFPSMVVNAEGNPIISYYDMTGKSLKLAFCQDPVCSTRSYVSIVDPTSEKYGEYSSLQLDSQGIPVVSYFDADNENLNLVVCEDPQCATYTTTVVDDSEEVGKSTSLALTDQDVPVISYFDDENEYLKAAICQDPTCTEAPTIRFFASGEAESGEFNALALDDQDRPIIAYQYHNDAAEAVRGAAMILFCTDRQCSDVTNVTIEDKRGSVMGSHMTMALTSDGRPVLAYWDDAGRQVKVAICKDAQCSGTRTRRVRFDWGLQYISVALDGEDHVFFSAHEVRPNKKRLVLYHPRFP